ncbi:ABC transporter permease [Daejeonella sp.]|uniref:ABC transporter permease n=2 Tax=Daejeonella sp. TaxID=2805397 RepID=UPI002CD6CB87|nr:ABC transporter permease [Daejeonella sp.]HQT58858.1 ABC transporter permease [Daejeonella sp.]
MLQSEEPHWDLIIKPKAKFLDLQLMKVWDYRDLLFLLVRRDFVAFYKQTILGPVWFFIQPLFTTTIYVFIFGKLAAISTDGLPAPLFYLAGITAWTYFSECLTKTATVFRDNIQILGKVYFPRLIMPFSIVASNLIKFFVQFLLLLILMGYYWLSGELVQPTLYLLLLPFLIILMAAQGLGLGMLISALTTKYRDLVLLLTFGIQLLQYATTVIYPLSSLAGTARTVIALNPMTYILEGMRMGLLGRGTFNLANFGYVTVISVVILLLGTVVFNKVEKDFVDTV